MLSAVHKDPCRKGKTPPGAFFCPFVLGCPAKMKKLLNLSIQELRRRMEYNIRRLLPAAEFCIQVPASKNADILVGFPASSCEPDCSAAVRFPTKPLRFRRGAFY